MNPDKIPDLQWQLASTYDTTNVGQPGFQTPNIYTYGIDVDTLSHAGGNKYKSFCGTSLNTDTSTSQSYNHPIACFDTFISKKV